MKWTPKMIEEEINKRVKDDGMRTCFVGKLTMDRFKPDIIEIALFKTLASGSVLSTSLLFLQNSLDKSPDPAGVFNFAVEQVRRLFSDQEGRLQGERIE